MRGITFGEELFEWKGSPEILTSSLYEIKIPETAKIMEVTITGDTQLKGIVVIGHIKAVIDSIIYTKSHGAIGNVTKFSGNNLVIFGLTLSQIKESIEKIDLTKPDFLYWKNEAVNMLSKINRWICNKNTSITFDNDNDHEFIIFGRRNFLLVASENKFVLVNKKQISVRQGDNKLVQIDPVEGIVVAEKNNVLNIGGFSESNLGNLLCEFGVNIASSVLDQLIWD